MLKWLILYNLFLYLFQLSYIVAVFQLFSNNFYFYYDFSIAQSSTGMLLLLFPFLLYDMNSEETTNDTNEMDPS